MIRDGTAMAWLWLGASYWWAYAHMPWVFEPGNELWALVGGISSGVIGVFIRALYEAEPNYDDNEEDDEL